MRCAVSAVDAGPGATCVKVTTSTTTTTTTTTTSAPDLHGAAAPPEQKLHQQRARRPPAPESEESSGGWAVRRAGEEQEDDHLLARHPRNFYIIPPDMARPLVMSSQLLLLQACAAFVVCWSGVPAAAYALPPLLLGTYLTSVNFWKCPSASNPWRYADYFMVGASVVYATLVTLGCTPLAFQRVWLRGWSGVALVFVLNEAKFWLNKRKTRRDYIRAVWIHLGAVHIGGNVLVALALCALGGLGPWQ